MFLNKLQYVKDKIAFVLVIEKHTNSYTNLYTFRNQNDLMIIKLIITVLNYIDFPLGQCQLV